MLEHFCYGNAMALCSSNKQEITQILTKFTHEDYENVRHLMSFRKLVERESYKNRISLLTDDDHLKNVLLKETSQIQKYIRRLHLFLRCLFILVADLPQAPLGKQVSDFEFWSLKISIDIFLRINKFTFGENTEFLEKFI